MERRLELATDRVAVITGVEEHMRKTIHIPDLSDDMIDEARGAMIRETSRGHTIRITITRHPDPRCGLRPPGSPR